MNTLKELQDSYQNTSEWNEMVNETFINKTKLPKRMIVPDEESETDDIVEADEADEVYYLLSDLFTYTRTLIYL